MHKIILRYIGIASILFLSIGEALAQEGFGTPVPDKSAVIDLVSERRGLLIPRVALVSTTNNTSPIDSPANSLLVYNTASNSEVTPGYYYWSEANGKWVAMAAEDVDLRLLQNNNHLTIDAGVGSNGTSLGTGSDNIAIGNLSLNSITSASSNIAIGSEALKSVTETTGILAIGRSAMKNLTNGVYNLTLGNYSGGALTTQQSNTIIGNSAFDDGIGSLNTFIGSQVAYNAKNRQNSIFIGYRGGGAIDGTDNISIGNFNYYWGLASGSNNTRSNVLVGNDMGPNNANQVGTHNYNLEYNVFLGDKILNGSGPFSTSPSIIRHSTIIGRVAGFDSDFDMGGGTEVAYATAIGANAKVGANNSIVLGRAETTGTLDNVGIGVTKPTNGLHVKATANPVRFEGLQLGAVEDKVMVVDANGVLKQVEQTAITPTANNGLNVDALGNAIQLGGALTKPTSITTTAANTLAVEGLQTGAAADKIVVADANGVLKQMKAAMPKFFYMPSIAMPTNPGHFVSGDGFSISGGVYTVSLYDRYNTQFGTPEVKNPAQTTTLPVLPANELDYYITSYDKAVFEDVALTNAGVLTYKIKSGAQVSAATFMNIVFAVKP